MSRALVLAVLLLAIATPVFGGDFDDVTLAVERQAKLDRQWIPFFGIARTLVRIAEPEGLHDIQLAVYENRGDADWRTLEQSFVTAAGRDFRPFISAREKDGDYTKMLARPRGKLLELMILTRDHEETVVIRLVADPERAKNIDVDHDFR